MKVPRAAHYQAEAPNPSAAMVPGVSGDAELVQDVLILLPGGWIE